MTPPAAIALTPLPFQLAGPLPYRRALLAVGAGLVLTAWMRPARAQVSAELASAIEEWTRGAPVGMGRVMLDVARLVDNGNVVPVTVAVESPMTTQDHVTDIAIFNERNPQRDVARFTLTPRSGKAVVGTRIRLATTQHLTAVARMNDGSHWAQTVHVVVALAACIEGEAS